MYYINRLAGITSILLNTGLVFNLSIVTQDNTNNKKYM